ncbi:hypothetical protein [Fluviicola sp.]|uniref:hypothetical protein n=1 Tax=Fluviicola sp. TaxID=1917219 RepID=UPI003D2D0BD5
MDNPFYLFSDATRNVIVERFHICSWDFRNKTSLIEFGVEINQTSVDSTIKNFTLNLYIPWLKADCVITDFYNRLIDLNNSKFIFNDVSIGRDVFDEDGGKTGGIQKFKVRENIVLLPFQHKINENVLRIDLNLVDYQKQRTDESKENLYFRFSIETKKRESIAVKKSGINKSTFLYDLKVNERRNLPEGVSAKFPCKINSVFYFNIVPNDFNLNFFDSKVLKNIRTLEYQGFSKYLSDGRVKADDLVVVSSKISKQDSYSFFIVYSNEIVGVGVLAIALLLNLLSGILLFLPALRGDKFDHDLFNLPIELYIAIGIWLLVFSYFLIKRIKPNWIKW